MQMLVKKHNFGVFDAVQMPQKLSEYKILHHFIQNFLVVSKRFVPAALNFLHLYEEKDKMTRV